MAAELAGVLEHIARIDELDLDGVAPTSHVVAVENALRADVPVPSLPRERVLADAPAVARRRLRGPEPAGMSDPSSPLGGAGGARTSPTGELERRRALRGLPRARRRRPAERVRLARRRGAPRRPDGPLGGVPLAVKDLFCTEGVPSQSGSRILEGYRPPYTATVVARLAAAGAPLLGKTNQDEFAMGSSTEHSAFGPIAQPVGRDARARAAPRAAAPRPSRPGSRPGRSAPTPAARSASRRRCAASSASSRPTAPCRATA